MRRNGNEPDPCFAAGSGSHGPSANMPPTVVWIACGGVGVITLRGGSVGRASPLAEMVFTGPAGVNPASRPIPARGQVQSAGIVARWSLGGDRGSGLTPPSPVKAQQGPR